MVEAKKSSGYKVRFAKRLTPLPKESRRTILVCPTDPGWNDFGLKSQFMFSVLGDSPEPHSGNIKVGFLSEDTSPHEVVLQKLKSSKSGFIEAEQLPQFFSLLIETNEYRKLVAVFGPREAQEILTALNDMALIQGTRKFPKWYAAALESKVFNNSLLRTSEAYFAFKEAHRIVLLGREYEGTQSAISPLHLEFALPGFSNSHDLELNFAAPDGTVPCPIVVLIGKNGLGKSQALRNIVESCLSGKDDERLRNIDGTRPMINRILAIDNVGAGNSTFPSRRGRGSVDYRRFVVGKTPRKAMSEGVVGDIFNLIRSGEGINAHPRSEIFFESIKRALPISQIGIPVRRELKESEDLGEWFPLTELIGRPEMATLDLYRISDKDRDPVFLVGDEGFPLSSGQLRFIRLAAWLSANVENGSLVLLDEPDVFLHPAFITHLVSLLHSILTLTGSRAVVATHSVYLVREVPRRQVLVLLEREQRGVEVSSPALRTLGADIGEVSFFVFEDELFGSHIEETRRRLSDTPRESIESKLKQLEADFSGSAIMYLRRTHGSKIE